MKKALALILCLIMVAAVAVSTISADEGKLIDNRDVREYGPQVHMYLGDEPLTGTRIPTVDGVVAEGEYTANFQFTKADTANHTAKYDAGKSVDGYIDNEWVKAYVAYGEDTLYLALVTKDVNYVVTKDGFGFNVNMKDGGSTTDAISRLCFDVKQNEDGSPKVACRYFHKQTDGSWNNPASDDGSKFIENLKVAYNETDKTFTAELALSISAQLEHWGNDNDMHDVPISWVPFTYMYGPSVAGGDDEVSQGNLWGYYTGADNTNIKLNFTLDYPEITYWHGGWFPAMIHLCEEPEPTTAAPTTTGAPTTPAPTTTKAPTAAKTTTAAPAADATTAAPAAATTAAKGGCGSTVALSALALVPMLGAAVVFGKKRED